ncbi:MAG: S49 family peptidase [Hyphomicrobiaceae bacterium]
MSFFDRGPVVPVLRFTGPIGMVTPLRPGLSLAGVAGLIEKAFNVKKAPAVAIVINSPGGSPVQSRLIYQRVRDKAKETGKPVYTFAEDVMASGGYMLACAGDEIYADPSSVVGSIGVVTAGFGFDKFIARYDVERRVHTIGKNKATLDPFRPEDPDDIARLKSIQKDIHDVFTGLVKESRGDKLNGDEDDLFDGQIWSGTKAVENGLIDGLSDVRTKMRELFGEKVKLKVLTKRRGLMGLRMAQMGPDPLQRLENAAMEGRVDGLADDVISSLEARSLWARYGF